MSNSPKIILAICLLVTRINALNVHVADNIDDIISYVNEVMNNSTNQDNESFKMSAEALDELKIDDKRNYADIVDEFFIDQPHEKVTDQMNTKLKGLISKIDDVWGKYKTKDLEDDDIMDLVTLPGSISELYKLYTGDGGEDYPSCVAKDSRPTACEVEMDNQSRLWKLHQAVVLSELRGFILNLRAGNNAEKAAAHAILHSEEYILATHNGFEASSDSHFRCNPEDHKRGDTFTEFLGLFQGILVNELQSSNTKDNDSCTDSCSSIDFSRIHNCYTIEQGDSAEEYCQRNPCHGQIFNCNHAGDTTACETRGSNDRRFEWADTQEMGFLGEKDDCKQGNEIYLHDYTRPLVHCPVCYCTCSEEDGESDALRAISLLPQFSDIDENKVVTGVKFVEKDNLIQIQIEQSELCAYGEIVPDSDEFVDLDKIKYIDTGIGGFSMKTDDGDKMLKDGVEFKFITATERKLYIDKLVAPDHEVIVGVALDWDNTEKAIELKILSWLFDYTTGVLENRRPLSANDSSLNWINWKNTEDPTDAYDQERTAIDMSQLDDPAKAQGFNPENSEPNQEIEITTTDYKIDMASRTIPYFDLQPVIYEEVKSPLSGLELIYKRQYGFGGFLGFKIRSYKFNDKFGCEMSETDLQKYKANFDDPIFLDIPTK
ncbi:uncharacterized protein LOC141534979 [Cotesia typhae]|uniref:uncharacterized protein LOC141534979 n=1 Tax=Cotesia typhae TaxID=2053667 RepID=UPI003D68F8D3